MAFRSNPYSWWEEPSSHSDGNCTEEQTEIEKFQNADQLPIRASEDFKKNLKEILWKRLNRE